MIDPNSQNDERHPVELLAEEFSERLRRGESPSIDEYTLRSPEHASLIRQVFAPILAMEHVGHDEHVERQFELKTRRLVRQHQTLGDFRILRQLGRGGMGVVYEAIQQSLRRHVALKVLTPDVAGSPEQLRRFRLEAEAVARLHHTNIVSVYGIGEADGLHFYAMQFINGVTISDVIHYLSRQRTSQVSLPELETEHSQVTVVGTPKNASVIKDGSNSFAIGLANQQGVGASPDANRPGSIEETETADVQQEPIARSVDWNTFSLVQSRAKSPTAYMRCVAQIGRSVADALHYAHQNGIVHRDIKPANLLLDDSTVWVTDFGIAKVTGEATQTRTGMLLGTFRYMAPEQFSGHADHRSDIYSLGLTLYELLTLRPAFPDVTHATLIKSKTTQSPSRLSSIRGDVPRDLETIISKACAVEADARYQSAGELADDLGRFLDDRPILARREQAHERLIRWGRRNPVVAGLSVGMVVSLAALVAVFATGNYRMGITLESLKQAQTAAVQNLNEKTSALAVAEQQRTLAAGNLAMAIEAFEKIMLNIATRGGTESLSIELSEGEVAYGHGAVTPADAEILKTLLTFFDRFSSENATDLTAATAEAHRRVGDIHARLGVTQEARTAYLAALEGYEKLESKAPTLAESERLDITLERMRIYSGLVGLSGSRGAFGDVGYYFRQITDLYEQVDFEKLETANDELAQYASDIHYEYAKTLNLRTSLVSRIGMLQFRGSPGGGPGPNSNDPSGGNRDPRRMPPPQIMMAARALNRDSEAMNEMAIRLLTELVESNPQRVDYAMELASAYRDQVRRGRGDLDPVATQALLQKTVEQLEGLIEQFPKSPHMKFVLADTLASAPVAIARRGQSAIPRASFIASQLVRDYPQVPEYVALKAKTLMTQADEDSANEAIRLLESLVSEYPAVAHYRILLAMSLQRLAMLDREANRKMAARGHLTRAMRVLESDNSDPDKRPAAISMYVDRIRKQLSELQ